MEHLKYVRVSGLKRGAGGIIESMSDTYLTFKRSSSI